MAKPPSDIPQPAAQEDEPHNVGETILQRSAFPWVAHEDDMMFANEADHLDTTTVNEVAFAYGVPECVFEDFLAKEIHEAESCYGLPFTLLLVASYAGMMISHHDAVTVFSVESALVEQIEQRARFGNANPTIGLKNLYQISSSTDFYSWLHQGLVPLIFAEVQASWELSEGYNDTFYDNLEAFDKLEEAWNSSEDTKNISGVIFNAPVLPGILTTTTFPPGVYPTTHGLLSFYNRLVGGIRLSQERVTPSYPSGCKSNGFGRTCVGGMRYETDPDPFSGRRTADRERVTWLWQHDNATKTAEIMDNMEREEKWIDEYTQKVEVAIATYNGEHNLLTLVTINFYFNRAGAIWKRIIPESVFAEQYPYDGTMYYVFDITWMACLGLIMVSESREVYQLFRRIGFGRSFMKQYFGFWNSVDWLSVVYGSVIIVLASEGTRRASWICWKIGALADYSPFWKDFDDASMYRTTAMEAMDMLEYLCFYMDRCRILFATYPLVITLRLLKAFSAQPRLAVVTRTLHNAGQDLIHFVVVFTSIYLAFVVSAILLFGPYMDEFATPSRAFIATFRCAMGDMDWDAMKEIGMFEAGTFLVMFISIVVFMMLNILLAIIMSAYYEISKDLMSSDTLLMEISQAYTRWMGVRRGDQVPLLAIAHALKVHRYQLRVLYDTKVSTFIEAKLNPFLNRDGQLRLVTVEFLKNSVMKMRTHQARELLESAVMHYHQANKSNTQIDQMLLLMKEMKDEIRYMNIELQSGPDSSSDSEIELVTNQAGPMSNAAQRKSDEGRRSIYKNTMEDSRIELHHARLWLGEAGTSHPVQAGGEGRRPKAVRDRDVWAPGQDEDDEIDEENLVLTLGDVETDNAQVNWEIESLEAEKADILERTKEALSQIDFLEPEMLRASEDTTEAGQKFYRMRQRVAALVEERHRVSGDKRRGQKDVQLALMSRAECFELVHSLSSENDGLAHQLERVSKDSDKARNYLNVSKASLRQAQHRLEPKLDSCRKAAQRAAATKANFFSDMLDEMEHASGIAFAYDVHGVAELTGHLRDMEKEAHVVREHQTGRNIHMGIHHHNAEDGDDDGSHSADCDYDEDIDELVDPAYKQMLVDFGSTACAI